MSDLAADLPYPTNGLHGIFAKLHASNICDVGPIDIYDSQLADFYQSMTTSYVADIPLFEQYATGSDAQILDLACGAGRIGIALARLGFTCDGLELSPAMIQLGRAALAEESAEVRARVGFTRGDITRFDLAKRYDLIILGITSISLLLGERARAGLFRSVARHLKDDGVFIFDILDLEQDRWREFDNYTDVWSHDTDAGQSFGIVGQRFYPVQRRFIYNVYRETIDWDGNTIRIIGASEKVWLDRAQLIAEMKNEGLVLQTDLLIGDQRFFIVEGMSR